MRKAHEDGEAMTDAERLDWLEKMSQSRGGILLHDGSRHCDGASIGLGIWPKHPKMPRTLRDAIDQAGRDDHDF